MQYAKVPVSDLTGVCETLLIPLIARAQARVRQIVRLHPRLGALADRNLSTRAVIPGRGGRALAGTSRSLRIATGGWLYGLAHLAIQPAP